MPDEGYHRALREITKRNGALLIFDEVKTERSWPAAGPANISESSRISFAWQNRLAAASRWLRSHPRGK